MFDNNPFREFKKMMKERNLKEEDHNMGMGTGAAADYDSKKEQEELEDEITSRIEGHPPAEKEGDPSATQRNLEYITSEPHILKNLPKEAVDIILTNIEQEQDTAGHTHETPLDPTHNELIGHVMKSPGYDQRRHGSQIDRIKSEGDHKPEKTSDERRPQMPEGMDGEPGGGGSSKTEESGREPWKMY
jgi:hypothetical protein